MVLGVLGYKIFVPLLKSEKEQEQNEMVFYLSRKIKKSNQTIEAQCIKTNEGFVVLAGSMIEDIDAKSIPETIKELRLKCKNNNEIVGGKITKNYLFNSPSYAASFLLGINTNGRTDWKNKEGISLKELEERELQE
ncbi:DUF4357 domain-containing protein [Gemella sp. zg-570]|uniref:DUF4357 domain-containing protein n=1 Tax=Gemella sp. zg-570 TaxID=2840371 RepID=UPI00209BA84C|nr:DUF4357 domain-containing protein [Gemella sp. zg-570]